MPILWLERIHADAVLTLVIVALVGWQAVRKYRAQSRAEVQDLPAVEIEWDPSISVFDQPERFGYTAYTRKHDQVIDARDPSAEPGFAERRRLLDQIIRSHAEATARLAKRLRELGVGRSTSAAILIDHSGSLRRKAGTEPGPADAHTRDRPVVDPESGAALAAGVALSLAQALEDCGAAVELLGFTTVEWTGGRSRLDWIDAGMPRRPGRLNDLLHMIYKRADETSVAECADRLTHLLHPPVLKENVDGEAIAWARSRLLATFASDRLLVLISDGASVDDSTLFENGRSYMERHLLHVLRDIENRRDLRIVGIGVGYDVSRYIPHSVALTSQEDFVERNIEAVAALVAGSPRL